MDIIPIVTIKNNKEVVTNSRDVAAYFGKLHRNVIAKIDGLLPDLPTPHAYFQAGVYTLPETGTQTHTCFDMTRDGFTLLAMGFTGKKALEFKLRYIEQFNKMEAMLKEMNTPDAVTATEIRSLQTHFDTRLVEMERRPFHPLSGYSHSWVRC